MKVITPAPSNRSNNQLDESMIPAINIVFLLLIFFMIAGHIEARTDQLKMPVSQSSLTLKDDAVTIQILNDGRYIVNGSPVSGELHDTLGPLVTGTDAVVTCKVDKHLSAEVLDPILNTVRDLGIKQLNIATEQRL